jgi:23S rRNA (adenine2503-C2)-methyltransferase
MPPAIDLAALPRPDLRAWLHASGHADREREVWNWLFRKGERGFSGLRAARLPGSLVTRLEREATVGRPEITFRHVSADGTRKWLLRFPDGRQVETVFIPDGPRGTLCVSSQVGCTLSCRFCHTGTQALARNLTSGEIVGQVLVARDELGDFSLPAESPRRLTNVVFMGMGEPLANYDAVADAVRVLADPDGLSISRRRITLSTSGIVPALERCGRELGVGLAISLHAARDEIRDAIMPINRKYPLADLLRACRNYPGLSNTRRILFAYTLLDGINDADHDARDLLRLLSGIPAKVNLIPFNPWPGAPYLPSPRERIRAFQRILNDGGLTAPIRHTRGDDILAACGQLKTSIAAG